MSADAIARLKITLNDVEPAVLRRIEVPFDIRLDRLHLIVGHGTVCRFFAREPDDTGNTGDKTHSSESSRLAGRLIPNSVLHKLPVTDQDVPLIFFAE